MKKLGFLMLTLAIAAMLGGTALAQNPITEDAPYFTTYYSNANTTGAPDETVRIINGGATGNNLYADIYVFDDSEELTECCSCLITPDGLLSESVNNNLTANPVTSIKPTRGVIKVLASEVCGPTLGVVASGLHAFATHVQKLNSGFALTEDPFADSNLSGSEELLLYQLCYY